jgi:HK97 family phage major capsid protein
MTCQNAGAPLGSPIELKSGEGVDDAVTAALTNLQASVDERLGKIEQKAADSTKLVERLDKLEAKMNRPAANSGGADKLETKAFINFARHGVERMQADEVKALTVSSDAAGGFLAPDEFASQLLKELLEHSPIRNYARVVTTGAAEVKYPRRIGTTTAAWVAETADRSSSQPAFDQVPITPFELATYTDISVQLLEDNAYNLAGELAADFAESFGVKEGLAFVKGTGSGQPTGILTAAGVDEVITGHASAFPSSNPADVIIGMFHALRGVHAQNGVWLMNRNTLGTVRKWKDGQGRYLVLDPISDGAPVTLLGRPIVEAVDMDDIEADAYPVIFGDMSGYRIVDRVNLSVLRDPFSLATKGQVRFHARKRVGANVTHPDRFVKLKVAAS